MSIDKMTDLEELYVLCGVFILDEYPERVTRIISSLRIIKKDLLDRFSELNLIINHDELTRIIISSLGYLEANLKIGEEK